MMEIKKIINLFRKAEGYIGLNAAYANEIAGFLEEYERRAENLVDHNADLNHRLSKAEFHIEMLEKQKEAMLKEFCDKEDLVREAEGRFYELEKELDTLKNASKIISKITNNGDVLSIEYDYEKKPETEWISVEDRFPFAEYGESDNVLAVCAVGIIYMLYFDGSNWCYPTGEPYCPENKESAITHWMPLPEPPKPKEPTFKDKFLEMFPKAELNNFRVPVVCAGALFSYLKDNCNTSDCSYNGIEYQEKCYVCWNQPYFEEEGM